MPGPKYQIFISSTYEDLKGERDQVIKACLEIGHIPVGMEMFSAADEEQWAIITKHIDESDYYVVIVANRYGSVADGISYTEKEYDYAIAQGVPTLGFILDNSAAWPSDRGEADEAARKLLDAFKDKVRRKPVAFWVSAEDLHGKCVIALGKAFAARPRPGWVRAPEGTGQEVAAELSRLSSENASLREEVEALKAAAQSAAQPPMVQLAPHWTLSSFSFRAPNGQNSWRDASVADASPYVEFSLDLAMKNEASTFIKEFFVNISEPSRPDGLESWLRGQGTWVKAGVLQYQESPFTVNPLTGSTPNLECGSSYAAKENIRLAPGASMRTLSINFRIHPPVSKSTRLELEFGHSGLKSNWFATGATPSHVKAAYNRLVAKRKTPALKATATRSHERAFVQTVLGITLD